VAAPRFPKPEPSARRVRREQRAPLTRVERVQLLTRIVGTGLLVALGVAIFWKQAAIRDDEASLAGRWFGALLSGSVGTSRDVVYFSWLHGSAVGMRITSECTVALLLGPLCLLAAALLAFARTRWYRVLLGLSVGLATAVVVNQLRLVLIAVAMQRWGLSGYHVSHKFVGTVIALAGFVAAALLMLRIATASSARRSHARS
jgi:exosortase/archaeosortase family protein